MTAYRQPDVETYGTVEQLTEGEIDGGYGNDHDDNNT